MNEQKWIHKKPEEQNPIELIQEAIRQAPNEIEAEFSRTEENNWLNCLGSMVATINIYLNLKETKKLLSPEEHRRASQNLDALMKRCDELGPLYPTKQTVPPDAIKRELIDRLDIFKK